MTQRQAGWSYWARFIADRLKLTVDLHECLVLCGFYVAWMFHASFWTKGCFCPLNFPDVQDWSPMALVSLRAQTVEKNVSLTASLNGRVRKKWVGRRTINQTTVFEFNGMQLARCDASSSSCRSKRHHAGKCEFRTFTDWMFVCWSQRTDMKFRMRSKFTLKD